MVGSDFSAIEVDDILIDFEVLYLFVELVLVLYAQVLHLLHLYQVIHYQLLIYRQHVRQVAHQPDLRYLRIAGLLYFKCVTEHIVDNQCSPNSPEGDLVELETNGKTAQGKTAVLESLLVVEGKISMLRPRLPVELNQGATILGNHFYKVLLIADVLSVD